LHLGKAGIVGLCPKATGRKEIPEFRNKTEISDLAFRHTALNRSELKLFRRGMKDLPMASSLLEWTPVLTLA
jgi:hypothetical protein